ncbi:efflux transporter outer membrane subunit [Herminiimonas aquatilis]|uniref:Efflux transporter outer membrane subunit n=1 Tax=Herminiimonas aquatilis TaxID=345342 RepID=A0ABW2J476_9BURK
MKKTLIAIAVVLALSACATHTPSQTQAPEVPAQWLHKDAAADKASATRVTQDWWRSFGSAELDALISSAQTQSLDVAAAVARVNQAQASATIAGAGILPELSGTLGAGRNGRLGGDAVTTGSSYSAGLSASYELDFWGRNRALRDGSQSLVRAAIFDRDTVRLTVTAGVASAWVQAVGLRERSAIAELSLASAQRLLNVAESRARAGAGNQLELAQQRGLVAAQQRVLAAIRQQAEDSQTTLAVLLGRSVTALTLTSADLQNLQAPAINAGLPSEILTQRPDIARAEARLVSADANITVARVAMLPSVVLTANANTISNRSSSLFDNPMYSLAAGLTAPIFNAGRLAAGRDLAVAQREELLANYRQAIIAAFGDVEVALNAVTGIEAQRIAQQEELKQAQRALTLAESRYRAGAETLLTLLDAQRTLYAAQDTSAQLNTLRLQASVSLYKALGGGWKVTAQCSSE